MIPDSPNGGARRPTSLPEAAKTLVEMLTWHAAVHGDRVHVRFLAGDDRVESLTYHALLTHSRAVAAGLAARGVAPRDNVAIMLPTTLDFFYAFYGILLVGAVPVPIYPPARRQQLEQLLRRQAATLANAEAVLLITVPEAKTAARFLRAKVPTLRAATTVDELRQASGTTAPTFQPGPDDLAFLQYTSGSTGSPKGVMLSHANLMANVRGMGGLFDIDTERDSFISWLPLYHDMGLIGAWLAPLYFGIPLVLLSPLRFLTRPERWLRAISEHRGTISAAPNFAYELCITRIKDSEMKGIDLSSLRILANGAEAVLPSTLRAFQARFGAFGLRPSALRPVYGLAENAVGLAFPVEDRPPRIDSIVRERFTRDGVAEPAEPTDPQALEFPSVGRVLPGHELRIAGPDGATLPDRRVGAIQFRGPSATRGYFRNPQATAALFDGDWLRTGDRGYLADGELFIAGRDKDLIIRAGRNLHAPEIEAAAATVRGIRKGCVAAFGMRGGKHGTESLVVLAETRVTNAAAKTKLADAVSHAIVQAIGEPPDEVVLTPPHVVLKTSSGKIRRAETRALYERGEHLAGRPPAWVQMLRLGLIALKGEVRRAFRR